MNLRPWVSLNQRQNRVWVEFPIHKLGMHYIKFEIWRHQRQMRIVSISALKWIRFYARAEQEFTTCKPRDTITCHPRDCIMNSTRNIRTWIMRYSSTNLRKRTKNFSYKFLSNTRFKCTMITALTEARVLKITNETKSTESYRYS